MAQPHIILWLPAIGRSQADDKEQSIVSLLITSFILAYMDPSKPPSSGEAMRLLCNYRMEYSSKSFGTLRFTLYSASMISKVSHAIRDSRTFKIFIIH